MKKIVVFFVGILMVLGLAAQSSAVTITNGSFESGDFTGWNVSGTGSVVTTSTSSGSEITYSATDGIYFAQLTATAYILENQTWNAGEVFTFDWAFQAFDYLPYNDMAYFEAEGYQNILSSISYVGNYGETDWATYSYTFMSAGSGDIKFGVNNVGDSGFSSKLLLDNVGDGGSAPVPEPATMLLFGLGLLGLAGVNRRKK